MCTHNGTHKDLGDGQIGRPLSRKDTHSRHYYHRSESSEETYHLEKHLSKRTFDPAYPEYPQTFGEKLRKSRIDAGLTIKKLASRLGVTPDCQELVVERTSGQDIAFDTMVPGNVTRNSDMAGRGSPCRASQRLAPHAGLSRRRALLTPSLRFEPFQGRSGRLANVGIARREGDLFQ